MIRMNDFLDDDLWSLFEASASGDLAAVKRLVGARPDLVYAQYNYTPAIHFAVREGSLEVARYLIDQGTETIDYRSYPFQDSLPFAASGIAYRTGGRHREQQSPSIGMPYGSVAKRERRGKHCLSTGSGSIQFLHHRDLPTRADPVAAATA